MRQLPTPEETAAHVLEIETQIAQMDAREQRGECFSCGTMIERVEQHGRCMYATPCACRLGQGDADEYNALLRRRRAA